MEYSLIRLNDLPDEILMMIFKKLDNFDVLYSLIGVNKRLDTIVKDSIFTECLSLEIPDNHLKQFSDTVLDRFCFQILPKIHHKIQWINVKSSHMERILRLTNYPKLYGLGLYYLAAATARDLFTDGSYLIRTFKSQILSFVIRINKCQESNSIEDINIFIFIQIFSIFKKLQHLNFSPSASTDYHLLKFGVSPPNIVSSTLLDLWVIVDSYEDCLYLLDGRFNRLRTLYVTICSSNVSALPMVNNEKKLPNLKCFVLILKSVLLSYNNFLIPLLHRMLNLEELSLCFVNHNTLIIDGNDLEMNIMNYMTKLKIFKFNIRSIIPLNNQVYLPSNDDIQKTFKNFQSNEIISSIDYFPKGNEFHCHVYSYPYIWTDYHKITNNFRGGLFQSVMEISLVDEHPFEHEFFLQIAKSFPLMRTLHVHNQEPQKNNNQQWSIIEYSHLVQVDLLGSHENYLEQFLNNTKTCLLSNICLRVDYNTLQRTMNNFTNDAIRVNCFKINRLILSNEPELSQNIKDYFAHAEIL
ncbi:unnamed protein product [Rotaria sp. Silwood1]|nr:unnamed protein product [Rotaria sp. Silwood1]